MQGALQGAFRYVRGDDAGAQNIFMASAVKTELGDGYYFDQVINSVNGSVLKRTTEALSRDHSEKYGIAEEWFSNDGKRTILFDVSNTGSRIYFKLNSQVIGGLWLENGKLSLNIDKINGQGVEWKKLSDGNTYLIGKGQ